MNLYPAIDLKDGQAVRLRQGRMEDATIFSVEPQVQAKVFADAGCQWLHIVDLNGAFAGNAVNRDAVLAIRKTVTSKIQLGGGIRNLAAIEAWLDAGIHRVILGTVAVTDPDIVREACKAFPGHVAVGIDTKKGQVATDGWAKDSGISGIELAKRFEDAGVVAIIHTDIDRDGIMQGPNLQETLGLAREVTIPVIVSGGVSSLDDLRQVKAEEASGLDGVIVGRALYEGMDIAAARAILEAGNSTKAVSHA
jgi:phosphoribosylformimino-5-aminoimidazole carboxamide ribotide isomerase